MSQEHAENTKKHNFHWTLNLLKSDIGWKRKTIPSAGKVSFTVVLTQYFFLNSQSWSWKMLHITSEKEQTEDHDLTGRCSSKEPGSQTVWLNELLLVKYNFHCSLECLIYQRVIFSPSIFSMSCIKMTEDIWKRDTIWLEEYIAQHAWKPEDFLLTFVMFTW